MRLNKVGGKKLDTCYLKVLLITAPWPRKYTVSGIITQIIFMHHWYNPDILKVSICHISPSSNPIDSNWFDIMPSSNVHNSHGNCKKKLIEVLTFRIANKKN